VSMRRGRSIRFVPDQSQGPVITSRGRPREKRPPISWMTLLVRLLVGAWAFTIIVALLDEFGLVAHLPFLLAMGMTGLLVTVSFLITREDMAPAPEAAGDGRRTDGDDTTAAHDPLTELPTFNYFARRLNDEFGRSRRLGKQVSIVLIDVNNLSAVNKEYGVRAGDEVLKHVAKVIDNTRRYNDVAARLGDDEFGVILLDTGEQGIGAFIDRLEDRLARDSAVAEVGGRSISLWAGVCSGSASSNPTMMQSEAVLEAGMASLNQAKQERERRRRMWLSA
jgi:diguanylate cyclase (GGDEF)-like protein